MEIGGGIQIGMVLYVSGCWMVRSMGVSCLEELSMPIIRHVCGLLLLGSFLAGCSTLSGHQTPTVTLDQELAPSDTRERRDNLIGRWHRKQPTTDGGVISEIAAFSADGTFFFKFSQTSASGTVEEFGEAGYWGVSGNIHFTITQASIEGGQFFPLDPRNPSNYIAYRILELSREKFTYQTLVTGNVFTLERVQDDFEFP